jgi:hypothetical protein
MIVKEVVSKCSYISTCHKTEKAQMLLGSEIEVSLLVLSLMQKVKAFSCHVLVLLQPLYSILSCLSG